MIFMNSENTKTSDGHKLRVTPTDKMDLRKSENCLALSDFGIYLSWKDIKKSHRKSKYKTSGTTKKNSNGCPKGHNFPNENNFL